MRIWRPRGRRAWLLVAVAVVGLVAGTLVTADRIAARVVAGRLADAIACATGLPAPPQVTVHGFPFISQVSTGRFTGLTVRTGQLGRGELPITELAAEIHDVEIDGNLLRGGGAGAAGSDGSLSARIGRLHAAVTVDVTQLAELAGDRLGGTGDGGTGDSPLAGADLRIRGSDAGQLVVELTADMFGQALPITLYAVPVLDGRTLRIEPVEVEVFGMRRSADRLAGVLGDRQLERELPELPTGLSYHDLTVTADGLRLEVTGESITVGGGGIGPAGSTPRFDTTSCR
ncbi:LmeA family phospholipid-binding protein [Micromonospora sp. NBC_01813]|uniref:LmeA family phospholipid-binding protein n=1 Tax=Micromonospora sp. NBC_01813 TaxID=2975988 RepID=UPI002DDB9F61|nr:DUF2993 domain-containing protein [Micromonospora sp. NBC_01813]WSA07793.1 DUF2993 domain-containing protein [Micromonospora sp. NBC_01813]